MILLFRGQKEREGGKQKHSLAKLRTDNRKIIEQREKILKI